MPASQKIVIETPTVPLEASKLIASRRAQHRLMELGGTHDIPYDVDALREDR